MAVAFMLAMAMTRVMTTAMTKTMARFMTRAAFGAVWSVLGPLDDRQGGRRRAAITRSAIDRHVVRRRA
jgi:hypothetical protein